MVSERHSSAVFRELTDYWSHFWIRDPEQEQPLTPELAESFNELLDKVKFHGLPLPNLEDDIEAWKKALKTCKKSSAPGVDGVTFAELSLLPDCVLKQLVRIVASLEEFPDWMMQARTIPLPKVANFPGVCDSRPITIMATICRSWAKVTTAALLKHLALNLPASITGLLPRRVSLEAAYDMQVLLENS